MQKEKVDLYKVLGVERSASEAEISKAYKTLAKRYHPDMHTNKPEKDRQKAEEKFKEISNAYEILVDKDKKAFYDATGCTDPNQAGSHFGNFGSEGFSSAFGSGEGINLNDLFGGSKGSGFSFRGSDGFEDLGGSFFRSGNFQNMFTGGFGHQQSRAEKGSCRKGAAPPPNKTIEYHLKVTLEDICMGTTKTIKIRKQLRNGQRVENVVHVKILPGYKPGTKITFDNAGDEHPDGSSTNIVVILQEVPHALYKLSGSDIVYDFCIGLKESLKPFSKSIIGLKGNPITITNEMFGSVWGDRVVKEEGVPDRSQGSRRGNLVIKPRVVLDLTPNEIEKVRNALF
ncbi:DnaJ-like protein subfamily B member 4 [Nematocida sp. AWRm77]|nr:DnaJ-like protein subfamily B member 4 [Nematocida sp. AWRm77]